MTIIPEECNIRIENSKMQQEDETDNKENPPENKNIDATEPTILIVNNEGNKVVNSPIKTENTQIEQVNSGSKNFSPTN